MGKEFVMVWGKYKKPFPETGEEEQSAEKSKINAKNGLCCRPWVCKRDSTEAFCLPGIKSICFFQLCQSSVSVIFTAFKLGSGMASD